MEIVFIGLGNMGQPMAINLVKAGFSLKVFDLNHDALLPLLDLGAKKIDDFSVCDKADIFITMLQKGSQVLEVACGARGFYQFAKPGSLHLDCSSIDVATSKMLHQKANEKKLLSLDAPVSGGVMGAAKGSLTMMVGGDEKSIDKAKPIFAILAEKVVHTGDAGTGQAAKICNNMILGISMAAISEAFALGEKLGLKSEKLFEVSSSASGQCWAMTSYCPVPGLVDGVPSNNNYRPGFSSQMMLKDLSLSQTAADNVNFKSNLGKAAEKIYQTFVEEHQGGDKDFSAVYRMIKDNV